MIGFYGLAAASVERRSAPGRVHRNMPDPVPVILLSRLAIERKEQGKGLGAHLLRDAITRSVAAADLIGVRAILVHALHDQARTFYTHFDFEASPTDPLHLLLPIKDARALVNQSLPIQLTTSGTATLTPKSAGKGSRYAARQCDMSG